MNTIISKIKQLASEKNAIILAHNYQPSEIQDLADFTGDSYELSKIAAKNSASIIVFCGVHFMAESASILSPDKKIILPALDAGCPMADMIDDALLRDMKIKHPEAQVVLYINSSAKAKTEADSICTSSNAVKIVNNIESDTIIFAPDKNLAHWVSTQTKKKIIPAEGFCPVHDRISIDDIKNARSQNPDAEFIIHPECPPEAVALANAVLSTGGMVEYVRTSSAKKIIVGTESGMIHRLKKEAPQVEFIPLTGSFICPNMKKTTLENVLDALTNESNVISVDAETARKARRPLEKMLELAAR